MSLRDALARWWDTPPPPPLPLPRRNASVAGAGLARGQAQGQAQGLLPCLYSPEAGGAPCNPSCASSVGSRLNSSHLNAHGIRV